MVREYAEHMKKLAYIDMLKLIRGISNLETNKPIIDGEAKFIFSDYYNARILYYGAMVELMDGDEKKKRDKRRFERKRDNSLKLVIDFEDEKGLGIVKI